MHKILLISFVSLRWNKWNTETNLFSVFQDSFEEILEVQ